MARPKRIFTEEEKQRIEEYALENSHIDTIALGLGIAKNTLIRRYGTFIKRKRAEGRLALKHNQYKQAINNPTMAIWLGKQDLGQVDKQVVETSQADAKSFTPKQIQAGKDAANAYNKAMSKTEPEAKPTLKLKRG